MAWDPASGQWTPDVFRQPLGALGSVMNYLNARRATAISDELQKNRAAQARQAEASAEGQEFDTQQERLAQEAIAKLEPNATADQIGTTYARFNPKAGMPFARSYMSGLSGANKERIKGAAGMAKEGMRLGIPTAQLGAHFSAMNYTPQEIEQIMSEANAQSPAPVPGARATRDLAEADLAEEKGQDIRATREARIDALHATAESKRINAQLRGAQRRGMKLSPDSLTKISGQISKNEMLINKLQNQTDAFGLPKRPDANDLMLINNLESENIELNDYREDMKAEMGKLGFGKAGPTATAPGGAAGTKLTPQQEADKFMSGLSGQ